MRIDEIISPNSVLADIDPYDFSHRELLSMGGEDDDGSWEALRHDNADTSIDTLMKSYGFTKLGAGASASVFTRKDRDYAIKIFIDMQYMKFYELAMRHPNIHYPKFLTRPRMIPSFKRDYGDTIFFVRLEKLERIDKFDDEMQTWADYFLQRYQGGKKLVEYDFKLKRFTGRDPKLVERFNSLPKNDLMTAFLQIDKYLIRDAGFDPDIHLGNIMRRKDGTIVIADPVQEAFFD